MKKRLFISHISEEREVAELVKTVLSRDFLGLLDVFVSSDTESIAAGEEWLRSIEKALRDCSVFAILCSPESIRRPWINFETGAAWMREIPIVPLCLAGLLPRDLRMPLSLKQGIALSDSDGLRRFYARIAKVLECDTPGLDFHQLALALTPKDSPATTSEEAIKGLGADRDARDRLAEALRSPKYKWRSLQRVAAEAAISEESAADLLRSDPTVRFSKSKSKRMIVGLRSRVDHSEKDADHPNSGIQVIDLRGEPGSDARSSSAWISLTPHQDLKRGERLRLILGSRVETKKNSPPNIAEKVLVRFLRDGDDENQPVGIITPSGIRIPKGADRVLEVTIPADFNQTRIISIHGGPEPFNICHFGVQNGLPPPLIRAERVKLRE
jgi:hypothetical protein